MAAYLKNNLTFRIASAAAIGKFKTSQSHAFLQLNRKEIDFDDAAKEAVLLEYDRFSNWIFRLEKMLLAVSNGDISNSLKTIICDSFSEELKLIENVMESNIDIFPNTVINFTKKIHQYTEKMYINEFLEILDYKSIKAFSEIVDKINDYLQHVLTSMHEFNNNLIKHKNQQFLAVTPFCINNLKKCSSVDPCLDRLNFFIKYGCSNQFLLKNYSNNDIFDTLNESFSNKGITIIREEQLETAEEI